MANFSYVARMLVLLVIVGVVGFAAQRILRPSDYGELGRYRAGGLDDILAQEPRHQGREVCGECHEDILTLHQKDIHFRVNCEDCHAPGKMHVAFFSGTDDSITEEQAAMPREYTLEGCLFCHRKLVSRPRTFPQIDPVEHFEFLHVTDATTRCIECHSPHEPLFLLTKVSEARIHPIIHECGECHDTAPEGDYHNVVDHPVIFTCRDCHGKVAEDFTSREHAFMRCTACHLFHQENPTAGRIFKNGNRQFCLLCHEKKPFKDPEGVPQIVSAEHLSDMGVEDDQDPRLCLTCHLENIHASELVEVEGS